MGVWAFCGFCFYERCCCELSGAHVVEELLQVSYCVTEYTPDYAELPFHVLGLVSLVPAAYEGSQNSVSSELPLVPACLLCSAHNSDAL